MAADDLLGSLRGFVGSGVESCRGLGFRVEGVMCRSQKIGDHTDPKLTINSSG